MALPAVVEPALTLAVVNEAFSRVSSLSDTSGIEEIRTAIKELSALEKKLLALLDSLKQHPSHLFPKHDAELALEGVVTQIARLISLAAHVTQQPTAAAAAAPSQQQLRPQSPAPTSDPASATSRQSLHDAFLDGPPEIEPNEIVLDSLVGQGAFARVYKGRCRGLAVAVKVPNRQRLTEEELAAFRREVTIMRKVSHPNVLQLLGVCLKPGRLMIVTELMAGDLAMLIKTRKLSLLQKLRMAEEAALGMNWLHGIARILHRDLKPENLLLDELMHVRVGDFGLSQILQGKTRDTAGPKGTALFTAPEVMRREEFDSSADVYSFGLILYQLVTENEPYLDYNDIGPFMEALCTREERPQIDPSPEIPAALVDLIERCWHRNPSQRPAFSQIVLELEGLIVDNVVSNAESPVGPFWKTHFLNPLREQVPWFEIEERIARTLGVSPVQLSKLGELLCTGNCATSSVDPQSPVSLERFQQFYAWFGPWFEPGIGTTILREVNTVSSAAWFHGEISSGEATARLQNRAAGTFLVRLSTSIAQCPFTISVAAPRDATQAQHIRVYRLSYDASPDGRYAVELEGSGGWLRTASLPELVDTLRTAFLLKEPCPRNKLPPSYKTKLGTPIIVPRSTPH